MTAQVYYKSGHFLLKLSKVSFLGYQKRLLRPLFVKKPRLCVA